MAKTINTEIAGPGGNHQLGWEGAQYGAQIGSGIGSAFGPIGSAAGLVVGGLAGYFIGSSQPSNIPIMHYEDTTFYQKFGTRESYLSSPVSTDYFTTTEKFLKDPEEGDSTALAALAAVSPMIGSIAGQAIEQSRKSKPVEEDPVSFPSEQTLNDIEYNKKLGGDLEIDGNGQPYPYQVFPYKQESIMDGSGSYFGTGPSSIFENIDVLGDFTSGI